MGLFRYYIRVFIRSYFRPINPEVARIWEKNTSYLYLITAWTTLVLTIHHLKKNKDDNKWNVNIVDPYENMKKFGLSNQFTFINVDGTSIKKETILYEELDQKKKESTS